MNTTIIQLHGHGCTCRKLLKKQDLPAIFCWVGRKIDQPNCIKKREKRARYIRHYTVAGHKPPPHPKKKKEEEEKKLLGIKEPRRKLPHTDLPAITDVIFQLSAAAVQGS